MTAKMSLRPVVGYLQQLVGKACCAEATDQQLLQRFVEQHDQDAFSTLVRRHGPLVMGTSLRALRHHQDAEDCFQATFLVLARKAGAIRWDESIAAWLHQVATRIAAEIRLRAARQTRHEQNAAAREASQPADTVALRDVAAIIDQEIEALPVALRGPMILCYLQGQTRDQAASTLGVALRTLERRLQCARTRLQARLLRRGVSLASGLAAWSLTQEQGLAIAPETVRTTALAARAFVGGTVSSRAGGLATFVLHAMAWEKTRLLASLILAISLCIVGLGIGVSSLDSAANGPELIAQEKQAPEPVVQPAAKAGKIQEAGTERAVQLGLRWIVRQQVADGRWRFDGGQENDNAATAMALLPLLNNRAEFKPPLGPQEASIQRGLQFLADRQKADDSFDGGMYAHAMVTWALCDGHRLTKDAKLKKPAQLAADYIVRAQHGQGGWRYVPNHPGDTSVSAWHILALKRAEQVGFKVPAETFKRATAYLNSVATNSGAGYSYTPNGPSSPSMTAAGLHCRQLLGWERTNPTLQLGAVCLQRTPPDANVYNAYYYYFATQAMRGAGGASWQFWEGRMADVLRSRQEKGTNDGSWPSDQDQYGRGVGRLMVTSLSLMALQACGEMDLSDAVSRKLSDAEIAGYWADLRKNDLNEVRRAIQGFASAPQQAVPKLRKHLVPRKAADAAQVEPLIIGLGSNLFEKRARALEQLKAMGEPAIPALRKALLGNPDLELRRRLETVLEFAQGHSDTPDGVRELRSIQILELIGTHEARQLLEELANGSAGAGLTQAAMDANQRLRLSK